MTFHEIIQQVAKENNTTPETVRREMQLAMDQAKQSTDPVVQARWNAIPQKGKEVTLEELIDYVANIVNSIC